ncbi:MAG: H4MPT-linked C1 transfer pathway protein [Alphaproteobacteria bacterium]|nr:H4MPT-linked C1 transfer pathway protein [Alphaproteobacteria bacterium]
MNVVIGWDIGGVHLKAARAEDGRIVKAAQYAAPLRDGTARLEDAFARARAEMGAAGRHVVTMTGELADTFASRRDGVARLAQLAAGQLGAVTIYAGRAGYIGAAEAGNHSADIASANWHASASLVARAGGAALLFDMGSTTTDIIPIVGGQVAARGYTDAERLAAGELVYTGLTRGFVMAAADRAPMHGAWTPLVNENFATLADVHRILGTLPDGADVLGTADGREKTVAASRARLARMVGRDAADGSEAAWTGLAQWFAEAQLRTIADAAMLVMSNGPAAADIRIVAAGIGTGIVAQLAARLGCAYATFDSLVDVAPEARQAVCQCAPAAALAVLGD